jgi:hypothetical protein
MFSYDELYNICVRLGHFLPRKKCKSINKTILEGILNGDFVVPRYVTRYIKAGKTSRYDIYIELYRLYGSVEAALWINPKRLPPKDYMMTLIHFFDCGNTIIPLKLNKLEFNNQYYQESIELRKSYFIKKFPFNRELDSLRMFFCTDMDISPFEIHHGCDIFLKLKTLKVIKKTINKIIFNFNVDKLKK